MKELRRRRCPARWPDCCIDSHRSREIKHDAHSNAGDVQGPRTFRRGRNRHSRTRRLARAAFHPDTFWDAGWVSRCRIGIATTDGTSTSASSSPCRAGRLVVSHEPSLHPTSKDVETVAHHKTSEIEGVHRYARVAVHQAFDTARRWPQDLPGSNAVFPSTAPIP
jgi:hypothetical protein